MAARKRKRKNAVALLMLVLITNTVVGGAVLYVDRRAPLDSISDHGSWDTAYNCLQEALQDARAGDEVRVAGGTYLPDRSFAPAGRSGVSPGIVASGRRYDSFSPRDGVVMKGGYAGLGAPDPNARDLEAYPSILSGDLQENDADLEDLQWQSLAQYTASATRNDNSYIVVTLRDSEGQTVLDGFTITGRHDENGQPYMEDSGFIMPQIGGRSAGGGGGLWVSGGRPTVTRCTFYRNSARSNEDTDSSGTAGVLCSYSEPTFQQCSFIENIAFGNGTISIGGAVVNFESNPKFIDCTFTGNVAAGQDSQYVGGAMANFRSSPNLIGCSFVGNSAVDLEGGWLAQGGAIFNHNTSHPVLTNCIFEDNSAGQGGAIFSQETCDPYLTACIFENNRANSGGAFYCTSTCQPVLRKCLFYANSAASGSGGAVSNGADCDTTAIDCRFLGNSAGSGGAWDEGSSATMANCLFSGNSAQVGGAITNGSFSNVSVINCTNCTFAFNNAEDASSYYVIGRGAAEFINCILWDDNPLEEHFGINEELTIRYSDVKGGWPGVHTIEADPRFQDALGPDGIAGTLDDNLRLSLGSPCLNAGDNTALLPSMSYDLDGRRRVANDWVDMGAYEFYGPLNYYVDVVNGDDTNGGWAPLVAFASIQKGIDTAPDGYQVIVAPGVYTEEINFSGKAITVAGSGGAPLLQAPDGYAVSFYTAETPGSVLQNFVIRGSDVGIFIAGASPTIRNVTLADNKFGIAAYAGSNPDISNCILWGNATGDLFGCTARFSCIEQLTDGQSNIHQDPLFGDAANGDYHLLSEGGRYVNTYGLWSFDAVTSPCVDAGDPSLDPGAERIPNGGTINMGAFGGTPQASMSLWQPCVCPDINGITDSSGSVPASQE